MILNVNVKCRKNREESLEFPINSRVNKFFKFLTVFQELNYFSYIINIFYTGTTKSFSAITKIENLLDNQIDKSQEINKLIKFDNPDSL